MGVSRDHVYKWECYGVCPSLDNLIRICNATGFEIIIKEKETAYYKTDPTRRKKVFR